MTSLTTLHIIQKKIVRLITFNDIIQVPCGPLTHTPPLFRELKILTIFDIFKLEINKFIFSTTNNISPPQFHNMFTPVKQINNIQTRSANNGNFYIHYARTTHYGLTLIKNIGARLWNSLPNIIRTQKSKYQFSKKLKEHFLSLY